MDSTGGHDEQVGQKQDFPRLLRHYRLAVGWTQEQLAEHADVSVRSIGNLERGVRHVPRGDTIRMLAAALDLKGEQAKGFMAAARAQSDGEPVAAFAYVSGLSSLEAQHLLPIPMPTTRDAARDVTVVSAFLHLMGRLLGETG